MNATEGYEVIQLVATDEDFGPNAELVFENTSYNGPSVNPFRIDGKSLVTRSLNPLMIPQTFAKNEQKL